MIAYRVQYEGRHKRIENLGLYAEKESAEFYVNQIGQKANPKAIYHIVEEEVHGMIKVAGGHIQRI